MALNYLRQQNIFDNYGGGDPYQQQYPSGFYEDPTIRQPSYEMPTQMPPNLPFGGQINPRQMGQEPMQLDAAPSDPNDYFKRLWEMVNKTYTPETVDRDRLRGLLDSFPERNTPGFGRTLAASMVGVGDPARGGGLAGAESVMFAPYMRDVQAWKEKVGPFGAAAGQENAANNIERQLAGNLATNVLGQERIDRNAQTAQARQDEINRHNKATEQIANAKIMAEKFKRDNPDWKFDTKGPYVIAMNPANPRESYNTKIPTGDMSDMEKIWWETAKDIAVKGAIPGVNPASIKQPTPPDAKEIGANRQLQLEEILMRDPTGLGRFIERGDDGSYRLKPRPQPAAALNIFGKSGSQQDKDVQDYDALLNKVYPNSAPPPTTGGGMQFPQGNIPVTGEGNQSVIPRGPAPPMGAAPPPAQPNITGIQQPSNTQRLTPQQVEEGIQNKTLLRVRHPVNGETGTIPNTYQAIEDAKRKGWNIEVGR